MLESASARSVSSSSCHFPCRSYSTFSIPMSSLRMSYVVKLIPVDSGLCIATHHEQIVNAKHDTHIIHNCATYSHPVDRHPLEQSSPAFACYDDTRCRHDASVAKLAMGAGNIAIRLNSPADRVHWVRRCGSKSNETQAQRKSRGQIRQTIATIRSARAWDVLVCAMHAAKYEHTNLDAGFSDGGGMSAVSFVLSRRLCWNSNI
jgi:hypothetical protein